ncbi:two-component system KDP operon response regulator KdpE [Pseudarthrobacter sp. W1I19]|nr:two-component system KDP operon response regulator KdpE [Pseudarthrobacter sp. W1I19]
MTGPSPAGPGHQKDGLQKAARHEPTEQEAAPHQGAKILVVDDDPHLLKALRITLAAHGYDVAVAEDGASALAAAGHNVPDIVVLDLGLPDMDGADVLGNLRRWSSVPVLVLSARHGSSDKVGALDAGADDYITKPFGLDELLARLRALMRRIPGPESAPVVASSGFSVDLVHRQVLRDGNAVRLTPTEWNILEILVRNPKSLVTQQQLLAHAWGPAYQKEANYLRVYMAQLRRKLEADPGNPRHLLTEPGIGYRFVP